MSEPLNQSHRSEQQSELTLPFNSNEKTDLKPIAVGCIFGLFLFLVIFIGFWVYIFTPLFNSSPFPNYSIYSGWVVFSAIIAFSVGSYVFLYWAVPKTIIRNFGRLPIITIARKNSKGGLKNLAAVRIIVSVFTLILVYLTILLVTFVIDAITSQNSVSLFSTIITIVFPLIGIILGPIMAIMIYSKTSTS
jgi:hypothetical protein